MKTIFLDENGSINDKTSIEQITHKQLKEQRFFISGGIVLDKEISQIQSDFILDFIKSLKFSKVIEEPEKILQQEIKGKNLNMIQKIMFFKLLISYSRKHKNNIELIAHFRDSKYLKSANDVGAITYYVIKSNISKIKYDLVIHDDLGFKMTAKIKSFFVKQEILNDNKKNNEYKERTIFFLNIADIFVSLIRDILISRKEQFMSKKDNLDFCIKWFDLVFVENSKILNITEVPHDKELYKKELKVI